MSWTLLAPACLSDRLSTHTYQYYIRLYIIIY